MLKSPSVKVILHPSLSHTLTANHSLRNSDSISRTCPSSSACPSPSPRQHSLLPGLLLLTLSPLSSSPTRQPEWYFKMIRSGSLPWWKPSTVFCYTWDKIQTAYHYLYYCPCSAAASESELICHHSPLSHHTLANTSLLRVPAGPLEHSCLKAFALVFPCPDSTLHLVGFFS